MMDITKTLAERGARYGQFRDHAVIAQDIKRAMCCLLYTSDAADEL